MNTKDATRYAISVLGGADAAAAEFQVTRQAIDKWLNRRVPADRVLKLEQVTGVSRHHLRPDVFGDSPN